MLDFPKLAVPDIDHPTPAHMMEAIRDELHKAAVTRGEFVPQWVLSAISQGAKTAFAEHDFARNAQKNREIFQ